MYFGSFLAYRCIEPVRQSVQVPKLSNSVRFSTSIELSDSAATKSWIRKLPGSSFKIHYIRRQNLVLSDQ